MRRTAFALGLVPAGAWVCLCLIVLSTRWWGLPLGVMASLLAAFTLSPGLPRVGFTLGWVGLLGYVVLGRPEGDWAIAADWRGYGLLGCGLLLLAFAVSTLPGQARAGEEAGESADVNLG